MIEHVMTQMDRSAQAIRALAQGISDHQARWRPDPDSWSILEVICHLADEEREDFRARLDFVLHRRAGTWPGIDPQGWVTARGYNQRDLEERLSDYVAARQESLAWLGELAAPDWTTTYQTSFGPITAGDLLASWAAHDLLHLRQLVELHRAYLVARVEPYGTRYAGDW